MRNRRFGKFRERARETIIMAKEDRGRKERKRECEGRSVRERQTERGKVRRRLGVCEAGEKETEREREGVREG